MILTIGPYLLPILQYLFNIPIDILAIWAVTSTDTTQVDAVLSDPGVKDMANWAL